MTKYHPFAGRKGSATRNRFARQLYADQHGACGMCGQIVNPTLRGAKGSRDAVVDHKRPVRLRPDLAFDESNLWLICRRCHATCDSIEKRNPEDDDRIAAEKAKHRPVGIDGYMITNKA